MFRLKNSACLALASMLAGCGQGKPDDPPEAQEEAVPAGATGAAATVTSSQQAAHGESSVVDDSSMIDPATGRYKEAGSPRLGDRRLVKTRQWSAVNSDGEEVIRCEVYQMVAVDTNGTQAPAWRQPWALELDSKNIRECQSAINRDAFFNAHVESGEVETLDAVDNLVSAIRDRRGWINQGRAHACGTDGLVYDIFPDGTARKHTTTLHYPNKRCRITATPKVYRGAPLDTILSIGGE